MWTRKRIIAASVVAAVVLILASTAIYLQRPTPLRAYDDPIDIESRERNTLLYGMLIGAGFVAPFVDVGSDRTYVAYDLPNATAFKATTPENVTRALEMGHYLAVMAAARSAPDTPQIVVLGFYLQEPRLLWSVATDDVRAFVDGAIDAAGLRARVAASSPEA